jgi:hypothetical protein
MKNKSILWTGIKKATRILLTGERITASSPWLNLVVAAMLHAVTATRRISVLHAIRWMCHIRMISRKAGINLLSSRKAGRSVPIVISRNFVSSVMINILA